MINVILTIGPQYAGKSTFCKKVVEVDPTISLISRDEILIELFGTVWLNSYSGGHYVAYEKMWEKVESFLRAQKRQTLILDCWNGPKKDRRVILEKLKGFGVETVTGWYFVTPKKQCIEWSLKRDPLENDTERWRNFHAECYSDVYNAFHSQKIEQEDGFDSVLRINPEEDSPENIIGTMST